MRLFSSILKSNYLLKFNKNINNYYRFSNYNSVKMSKNALLLLADGAEEMEVVITADVLRRAGVLIMK